MGRIGKNIKAFIAKLSGSGTNAQFISTEEFSDDQRTSQVFGPCNEDFAPPESCKSFNLKLGRGRGFLVSLAYHNQLIEPVAIHGERRIYSTNQAGNIVKAEAFFKQDGTIDIKNSNAEIKLFPDGEILIENGNVTITATQAGLLTIVTSGNSEITSAKTIINNDVEINGNIDMTGIIKGLSVFGGPDSDQHAHEQGNDSDGDSEVKTDGPS